MAIGTTAAILGAAAIGGGTALIGGKVQSDAAKKTAQAATTAANTSDQTLRYIFDQTRADNALGRQVGDAAQRQLARIMGLDLSPRSALPGATPHNALGYGGEAMDLAVNPLQYGSSQPTGGGTIGTGQYGAPMPVATPEALPTATGQGVSTDWLRGLPGYDFNFREGMRGLNLAAGNRGLLNSGGAAREAIRYGQNYGDRIFNQERNALFNLAGMGQVANSANQQAGQAYASGTVDNAWNRSNALGSSYQDRANAWTNALGSTAGAGLWALGR